MQANFVYYQTGSTELENGYFFPQSYLKFFASASYSGSINFGLFKEDIIEFSVYNAAALSASAGDLVYWSETQNSQSSLPTSRSYSDLNNKIQQYSYTTVVSDFAVLKGTFQQSGGLPEILLSPVDDLCNAGYGDGNYVVSYNFLRNVVGENENPVLLYVSQISPSRTEVMVLPQPLKSAQDSASTKLIEQYYAFGNEIPYTKYLISDILSNIQNPPVSDNYYFISAQKSTEFLNQFKVDFAFQTDDAIINFIETIYQQVSFQLEQYVFANYDSPIGFSAINNTHTSLSTAVITTELNKIRLNTPTTTIVTNFNEDVAFLVSIFQTFLDIGLVKINYQKVFGRELKYFINFGNNNVVPILNWTLSSVNQGDFVQNQPLLLKLPTQLADTVQIGNTFWISNQQFTSMYQNVYITSIDTVPLVQLAGPDFTRKIKNTDNPTKKYNYDTLTSSGSVVYDNILNTLNNQVDFSNLNVDYTSISNFVHFSSIETRLYNYNFKISTLNQLAAVIASYSQSLNYDQYSLSDQMTLVSQSNQIIQSFDGYESFLYSNPEYYIIHLASASVYDKENPDYLINNTPDYLVYDSANEDYVQFLKMIGHHFDLIWLYIDNFPSLQYIDNRFSKVSQNLISNVLESLGWDFHVGTDNQDLALNMFGQDNNGNLIQGAGSSRTFEISKRILNSLPYLLKTKGTEESIRALFKCYGIPNHIFDIREYGGIEYSTGMENDSLYVFDDLNYMLTIEKANEYLQIPWTSNVQTIEFKFSISETADLNAMNLLLAVNGTNWAMGIRREAQASLNGQFYFTIQDGFGNFQTIFSDMLPLYNGEVFSVMLRKNNPSSIYNLPACPTFNINDVPTQYDLHIERYDNGGFTFYSTSSIVLSGPYNDSFTDTSFSTTIGNNPQYVSSGSINYFVGSFDNIRFWSYPMSDDVFDHHVQFSEAYDSGDPTLLYNNLLVRLDFDIPVDLSVTSSYQFPNGAFNQNLITGSITANNFRNVSTISSSFYEDSTDCPPSVVIVNTTISGSFPYQFTEFDTRETVQLPNFGANKFRSNKVRVETLELVSPLSFNSRSTISSRDREPADSNKLAITFSPVDQINLDILKFFGNFQLGDYIGDPGDESKGIYKSFEIFKKFYYNSGFQNIDFQQYINTFSAFIDPSLFEHIKNLVPARSKLLTGIMIEPSILERPKISQRRPQLISVYRANTNLSNSASLSGKSINVPNSTITVGTGNQFTEFDVDYLQKYFGEIDDGGFGIFSDENGITSIIEANLGARYIKKKFKVEVGTYEVNRYSYDMNGTIASSSLSLERLNLIPIPDGVDPSTVIGVSGNTVTGYYKKHYRFKRKMFNTISVQDSTTTIDSTTGLLNGSSPVLSTAVDRGSLIVASQGGGNILNPS